MALLTYDFSDEHDADQFGDLTCDDLPLTPTLRPRPERIADATAARGERGTFNDRVAGRRVNLIETLEKGLPALEFLPASDEMLIRGKRHALAAPYKQGKSIAMLVHSVDMVLAGAHVSILDRENGAQTYAMRLGDIIRARNLTGDQRSQLWQRLSYFEFPSLRGEDGDELVELFRDEDLVIFDSQRKFLSALGLKEDSSDDYNAFMEALIDPLFEAGVATLILDNTGHTNKKRGRGTSSKGDLNEVLFSLATVEAFDLFREGSIRLTVEWSRFGNVGEWTMPIGGGRYGVFQNKGPANPRPDFEAAVIACLEQVQPLGMDKLIDGARNRKVKIATDDAREHLRSYAADVTNPVVHDDTGFSLRPTPEAVGVGVTPE